MTLRELIRHRNLTQTDLAAALGVSQAMVSKWVNGKRNPKWQTATRIAGALNAVVVVNPPHKGANWNYTPVELSYLDDAE